jgi:glycosyltransferase involved in cell wall biosynthesis
MHMPRVSIVIPVYNAAAFVREAVDSALAQTHPDTEVIVIDDGSTDETPAILAAYGNRIRVHRQRNTGVGGARNTATQLATGEWLAFLDADDVWAPRKIETQLDAVGDGAWVYTNRFNFGARGPLPELQSDVTLMTDGDVFVPLLLRGNFITLSSAMMRTRLVIDLGGFCCRDGGCSDWDLWLRAASRRHEVRYVAEPLVGYRFTSTSMSANHRRMTPARRAVVARALETERGRALPWRLRRRIWAETYRTNGWDAARSGARWDALADYARAAAAWPLDVCSYKAAVKVCLNA